MDSPGETPRAGPWRPTSGHWWPNLSRRGLLAWHEQPGYWQDIARHVAPDTRLLDVGSGSAWLGDHFKDYTGIDVSAEAVAAATARGREVLLVDDTGLLRFDNDSFDGVVLKDVLEHAPDPVALVGEVRRVLRDGGACLPPRPRRSGGSGTTTRTARPFTRKSFRLLFEDQGLAVETVDYESVMPGTGIVSGLTRRKRRVRLLGVLARLLFVRRNVWLLARG